jgi:hypothetical protein
MGEDAEVDGGADKAVSKKTQAAKNPKRGETRKKRRRHPRSTKLRRANAIELPFPPALHREIMTGVIDMAVDQFILSALDVCGVPKFFKNALLKGPVTVDIVDVPNAEESATNFEPEGTD